MRSIAQMKLVILRSVDDPDGDEYDQTLHSEDGIDFTILDERMWDAARIFWGDLMADPRGRGALYTTYSDDVLSADIEEYDLPGDCAMLLGLDIKWNTSQERWTPLENRAPPRESIRSGSNMLFGQAGYYGGSMYWYDDLAPGKVRIWPALNSVNDETIRFRYLCTPVWPPIDAAKTVDSISQPGEVGEVMVEGSYEGVATTKAGGGGDDNLTVDVTVDSTPEISAITVNEGGNGYTVDDTITLTGLSDAGGGGDDDGTFDIASVSNTSDRAFDDPDGDGVIEYPGLPSETDMAIEALTAAFLAEEELEDGKPVGYFGQKYNMLLARILRVTAGQIAPGRRYVHRTRRSVGRVM